MARAAQASGFVSVVGTGVNRWSTVHIEDVVDLYIKALELAPAGSFYFSENGDFSFAEIGEAIGRRIQLPVRFQSLADAADIHSEMPARYLLGSNSVVRGARARRELRWAPSQASLLAWIEKEMPASPDATDA